MNAVCAVVAQEPSKGAVLHTSQGGADRSRQTGDPGKLVSAIV